MNLKCELDKTAIIVFFFGHGTCMTQYNSSDSAKQQVDCL